MAVTASTDFTSTLFDGVASVCSALQVELAIFFTTVFFVALIKYGGEWQYFRVSKKGLPDDVSDCALERNRVHRAQPRGARASSLSSASLQARSNRAPSHDGTKQISASFAGRDHASRDIVEKLRSIVAPQATQKLAGQAIHVYETLRCEFGLQGHLDGDGIGDAKPVADAAEQGRWTLQSALRQCMCSPIDLYTSLLNYAIRCGQHHLVASFILDMRSLNIARTPAFYESAMKQLAGQKQHRLALAIYDELIADGQEPSAITCSCLISFAAEVGQFDRAVHFYKKLETMTTPSIRACMTILRVYSKQLNWSESIEVLNAMKQRGITVDSLVLNIVLATGIAADRIEEAAALLKEHANFADIVSYNTLAKGFAQRGDADKAFKILDLLRSHNLEPNAITFNTILDAVGRSSGSAAARSRVAEVLAQMRAKGICPDKFTCSIVVRLAVRDGRAEYIVHALKVLREAGERCEIAMRTTLYQSLLEAANTVADEVVLMQVQAQMRQQNVLPGESGGQQSSGRWQSQTQGRPRPKTRA
eukprot:TRINITY_DN30922_c0_g1_i1.p1 TRINITY_DN30922_c0_g1~~TRINITY_DN30922_c0_g1_i1.p1  ORF type:complete len:563 (-),score=113.55 TRINITY_DN30922_c0_g1_i1:55-1656(-)